MPTSSAVDAAERLHAAEELCDPALATKRSSPPALATAPGTLAEAEATAPTRARRSLKPECRRRPLPRPTTPHRELEASRKRPSTSPATCTPSEPRSHDSTSTGGAVRGPIPTRPRYAALAGDDRQEDTLRKRAAEQLISALGTRRHRFDHGRRCADVIDQRRHPGPAWTRRRRSSAERDSSVRHRGPTARRLARRTKPTATRASARTSRSNGNGGMSCIGAAGPGVRHPGRPP